MSAKVHPVLVDLRTAKQHVVKGEEYVIGRDKACHLTIPMAEISRRHCRIYREGDDFFVEDLGTVNGTFVNDLLILQPHKLEDQTTLKIARCEKYPFGTKVFTFRLARFTGEVPIPEGLTAADLEEGPDEQDPEEAAVAEAQRVAVNERGSAIVPLEDCIFSVGRPRSAMVRVPMTAYGNERVQFLDARRFSPGDALVLNIDHPLWFEFFEIPLQVDDVTPLERRPAWTVTATPLVSEEDRIRMEGLVESSPMMEFPVR